MKYFNYIIISLGFLFAGCTVNPLMPAVSEYLETTAGGFNVETSTHAVSYYTYFDVIGNITSTFEITVEFENPVDANAPLFEYYLLNPGQKVLQVDSKKLPGIQNNGIYKVKVTGINKATGTTFKHLQSIQFIMPPGI